MILKLTTARDSLEKGILVAATILLSPSERLNLVRDVLVGTGPHQDESGEEVVESPTALSGRVPIPMILKLATARDSLEKGILVAATILLSPSERLNLVRDVLVGTGPHQDESGEEVVESPTAMSSRVPSEGKDTDLIDLVGNVGPVSVGQETAEFREAVKRDPSITLRFAAYGGLSYPISF